MTSSKFRPPSPPDAPVSGEFDLQEGEEEEEGSGDVEVVAPEEVGAGARIRGAMVVAVVGVGGVGCC